MNYKVKQIHYDDFDIIVLTFLELAANNARLIKTLIAVTGDIVHIIDQLCSTSK